MRYNFKHVQHCNMCSTPIEQHDIIGRRLNKSQGRNPSKKVGIATTVLKCNNCGLIHSSPMPIPLNLQDHYGVPPESYWTPEYFKNIPTIEHLITKLEKHLDFSSTKLKALDIGAGIGKRMRALDNHGFESYGIEPSKPFHEKALSTMKISPQRLQCVAIEKAEFEPNQFDFITFGAVLEHLEDPSLSIEKALKWLKPGGIIEIQVPSSRWLTAKLINIYYKITFSDFCSNLSPMHSPYHLYEFDLKSFEAHASKHNYSIVDVHYEICNTFLPSILDPILRPIMKKTKTGMEIYVLLKKN